MVLFQDFCPVTTACFESKNSIKGPRRTAGPPLFPYLSFTAVP